MNYNDEEYPPLKGWTDVGMVIAYIAGFCLLTGCLIHFINRILGR